jgi:hypothetical protein
LLSIPATSAPSERLWSIASRIATGRRANLNEKVIQDIMFVRENAALVQKYWGDADVGGEGPCILPKIYDMAVDAPDLDVGAD